MKPEPDVLQTCLFFRGKSIEELDAMLETMRYTVRDCSKSEMIISEGETADRLGIVLSGVVEVHKIHPGGGGITIARLKKGQTFGEAVLFRRENVYPATIISAGRSTVMFIGKQELLRLFAADTDMLSGYMENLSERLVMVNRKLEILSAGSLRRRVVHVLLRQADRQGTDTIRLPFSRKVWAEHLNAARPSLSREMGLLRDNGWIAFKGNTVTLLDRKKLEDFMEREE
ncbi:Crp/Fnr family transcriptional regulator [Paenibacillus zanthoxyli]|uniref:Crp/Fnr family transcriptional regulator n=1 Tax=Paenibacillus zanthoxyli TaxID=369399 RepID=UPI0004719FB8|nr:Crp/Fnr family transcriptional regulator [Paenibacillus zanthoxyli]